MYTEELYPELVDYIFGYESRFQTEDEKLAARELTYSKSRLKQFVIPKAVFANEPEIKEMMAGGYESFKFKVVERIYKEHKHKLNLNLCPECGKIARTPQAQQCRWCFVRFNKLPRVTSL